MLALEPMLALLIAELLLVATSERTKKQPSCEHNAAQKCTAISHFYRHTEQKL